MRQDSAHLVALTNVSAQSSPTTWLVKTSFYTPQRLHLFVSLAFVYELLIRKVLSLMF